MRTIAFYISGHGFGHASRDIAIINSLLAHREDVRVIARTSAKQWLFDRTVIVPTAGMGARPAASARFARHETHTDTGVIQIDSLRLDETATVQRAREFMATFDARVAAEVEFLRQHAVSLVVADIPPLGIAAAHAAGLPAVALGNFTWDWIYSAYADSEDIVRSISDVYRHADLALRLPMHGGFACFDNVVDIPWVAARSARDSSETRRVLGLPADRRLVLVSFGGYGVDRIDVDALRRLDGYFALVSGKTFDEDTMFDAGLRYEDVVRAADAVVTKPGYGIISECIANDTALLYTERGRFVEYDVMVTQLPQVLRSRFIGHDDLFSGRWSPHLDALLAQPDPPQRPVVNGAGVVVDYLLRMI